MQQDKLTSHYSRRTFLRLSAATLTGSVLAACGSTPAAESPDASAPESATLAPTSVPATSAPATATSKTLTLWHNWGGVWQEAIQQVADNFVAANPSYAIDILPAQSGSEGVTKFLAAVAAGNPPDLFTVNATSGANLISRGAILPVDAYLQDSPLRTEDFFPAQLNYYTHNGELYGLPTIEGGAGQAIIWNKAHFAEIGLDPEVGPQSFDDIVAFSEQLTQIDSNGNLVRLGFDPLDARGNDLLGWWFEHNWYDPRTGELNLTSDDLVWGADWVVDFARRVGPEKYTAFRQQYASWTNDPRSGFIQGAQSMVMSAYYVPGELARLAPDLDAGYTWVPTRDNQKTSTIYGWFWALPRGSEQTDDAWQFIEFASSLDSINTIYEVAGGYPSYKPFLETADFSQYEGLQWFIDSSFEAEKFYTTPPVPISIGEITDRLKSGMDSMSFDRADAATMLTQVQSETQPLIDQA